MYVDDDLSANTFVGSCCHALAELFRVNSFVVTSFLLATQGGKLFSSRFIWRFGSMSVSGKLPTYPSRNLTFCLKREGSVNVRFGEG